MSKQVCRQILSRPPTADERDLFVELLADGFEQRARPGPLPGRVPSWPARDGVSWSNHLRAKTNEIRLAWQKEVEKGDPPTTRLTSAWRERAEDMVWALVNSPGVRVDSVTTFPISEYRTQQPGPNLVPVHFRERSHLDSRKWFSIEAEFRDQVWSRLMRIDKRLIR